MDRPLQTRSCSIKPQWLMEMDPAELFTHLEERGFNTVMIPVLKDGSVCFWADSHGDMKGKTCHGREALVAARERGFTILLEVDFLSAGPTDSRSMGSLAAHHRNWLVRSSTGRHRVSQFPEKPGLFCWTAIEFKRYLSNLLVSIVEGHPIDGVVVDLRRLPRTTHDPRSWTHLGYSCLERIPRELGIDIEDFLNQPSVETLERIDSWRVTELHQLLAAIKARIQVLRQEPLLAALVNLPPLDEEDCLMRRPAWVEPARQGVLNELIVALEPGAETISATGVDSLVGDPMPLVQAFPDEGHLLRLAAELEASGYLGYCIAELDLLPSDTSLETALRWSVPGGPEFEPLLAAQLLLDELARRLVAHPKFGPFFRQLHQFLVSAQGAVPFEDVAKIRTDLIKGLKTLRQQEEYAGHLPLLERVIRLLRLSPIGTVEY